MKRTWLIVLLAVLLIVTVGLLAHLYFFKEEKTNESSQKETETITTQATQKAKILSNIFLYPGATIAEPSYNDSNGSKVILQMKTIDYVHQVSDYYIELAEFNNWTLGSRGVATDDSGGWLNIEQDDFSASIQISRAEKTTSIEISIRYDNETLESSVKPLPENKESATATKSTQEDNNKSEFVFADSNTRELTREDLIGLSEWELKVARNEIYARHGREFVHEDLKCYFAKKDWYKPSSNYSPSDLSTLENKNVALILNYEKEINSSLLSTDSGCREE